MNIQDWFPLALMGLISLLSKRFSWVFLSTTFKGISSPVLNIFYVQLSHLYMTPRKTIAVTLLFNSIQFDSQFSSVQSLSHVRLFATPWITACQASLSITNSWSLFKLMLIESVMPSSHLILCHPLLLLPPIPPSIRVFSNESTLLIRWPKYWSFSFSISPSNEHPGLISFRMD